MTASSQDIAYITDSSIEGRTGIIIVDLGTGESWRHLEGIPQVEPEFRFVAVVWGEPVYSLSGKEITTRTFGADGIALSADGETLYWSVFGGRYLYSVPTAQFRDRSVTSEITAQASVVNHLHKGVSDGVETDSNGLIYAGNLEDNSIELFNPANGTVSLFARDPRMG